MEPSTSDSKKLTINFKKLEEELQKEIREDELYWLRNEAKLRSVTQGTPTYEDFRQIVLAAHLKPISKEDKHELERSAAKGQVIWNNYASVGGSPSTRDTNNENNHDDADDETTNQALLLLQVPKIPNSKQEFCKCWKSFGKENYEVKWMYLKLILNATVCDTEGSQEEETTTTCGSQPSDENILRRIFAEEVPPEIFPGLIQCLLNIIVHTVFSSDMVFRDSSPVSHGHIAVNKKFVHLEDWKDALHILYIMTLSKRHGITLGFLSEDDKKGLDMIFDKIQRRMSQQLQSAKEIDGEEKIFLDLLDLTQSRYSYYFPQTPCIIRQSEQLSES